MFAAALLAPFLKVVGVEILTGLHGVSLDLLKRWNEEVVPAVIPACIGKTPVELICGDFTTMDMSDATVWFANSTCFNDRLMRELAEATDSQAVGTFAITFTRSLPSPKWKVLESELHQMSWGGATVFIQQKILP